MKQTRNVPTREFYEKLLIAFRDCPGNATLAARRALCDRRMAKRAWVKGWPDRGLMPIKDALEEERLAAMAHARDAAQRAREAQDAERQKAKEEAIEAASQERQMLRVARGDVLGALVLAASLVPAMQQAAKAIAKALEQQADGSPLEITPKDAMGLLTRHAQLIQRAVGAAEAVIQLSRLDRGATTANVGIVPRDELSLEEALDELEAVEEVLSAAKQSPLAIGGRRALTQGRGNGLQR